MIPRALCSIFLLPALQPFVAVGANTCSDKVYLYSQHRLFQQSATSLASGCNSKMAIFQSVTQALEGSEGKDKSALIGCKIIKEMTLKT